MQPTKPAAEAQEPASSIDYRKSESFRNEYANNAFLEPTAWDLKFNFGQLDQSIGPNVVVQHTGITLPWNQVKILVYFLQVHLAAYEIVHGRVRVPKDVINPALPVDKETAKKHPSSAEIYKALAKLYDDFMAANPEAAKESP